MAKFIGEAEDRSMVKRGQVSRWLCQEGLVKWLFFTALLVCLVLPTKGVAADEPLIRFDSEPASEPASEHAAVPRLEKRHPEPATDAMQATRSSSSMATIRGAVFYNDRRTDGLFATRRDKDGNPGQQCDSTGKRDDGSACSLNWLAGKYMVVDVIERDEGFLPTDFNCRKEDVLTSATVAYDGSFITTFSTDDACKHDKLSHSAIELRVRLKFCNASYCFSINEDKNRPYAVTHQRASAANPMTVKAGDDITMTTLNFSTASDPAQPNNYSIAANYYASIVDTILTLHKDSTIPFYQEEFGEIQYLFPSTRSSTATALSPTEVAISTFQSQPENLNGGFAWVDGKTPAHEYGHIIMQRAWDGSYGFKGVGISAGDNEKAPSQQIAFKEGWAEFIARAVFQPTRGCDRPSFDDNAKTRLNGPLGEGAQWRVNIIKALCDWYDDRDDDDPSLDGPGDRFTAEDIYSMWYNLRRMYVDADKYGGEFKNPGLWFCDYVRYYLQVRKSASAVGQSSHASYEAKIRDLIYNNNIGCFMPAPS